MLISVKTISKCKPQIGQMENSNGVTMKSDNKIVTYMYFAHIEQILQNYEKFTSGFKQSTSPQK